METYQRMKKIEESLTTAKIEFDEIDESTYDKKLTISIILVEEK